LIGSDLAKALPFQLWLGVLSPRPCIGSHLLGHNWAWPWHCLVDLRWGLFGSMLSTSHNWGIVGSTIIYSASTEAL